MSANAQQIEYWNGAVGERWAKMQERIDLVMNAITDGVIPFANARSGERVLDVGCGCGTTTLLLAMKIAPEGKATGIDISAPMLAVAQARAQAQDADVHFVEADASAYDFQPIFDLIFSRFGVMFFADPTAAFANIRRALAPNGRLAFVCWRALADNAWASMPIEAAMPLLPPQEPTDPLAPGPFAFADRGRLQTILRDAGYRDVSIGPFDTHMSMGATPHEAADQTLRIGPLARAVTELNDAAREKIRDVVAGVLTRYQSPSGITPPAACWLVRART